MNRELQNSIDYIKSKTQNEHNFSIPENYFNSVEDAVFSKISEEAFSKENPYTTPTFYFENFEEALFSKLDIAKKEVKVISLKSRILNLIPTAAAASILLFIGLNYLNTADTNYFENISPDDLEIWLNERNYGYSNSPASIEFVDSDFNNSNIVEDDTSVSDEDILEYFKTIDNSTLILEIES
jgi:hypothetical protein